MTGEQENRFSMFLATETVCVDNTATWTPVTAFGTAFTNFQAGIVSIQNLRNQQQADLKGIAENKSLKRTALISQALAVAKPTVAYANVTNNTQLRQEVDYSETDLRRTRDTDLETICNIIHDRANTNAAALIAYGVTALMITDLATAITDYHATISGPRSAIAVRKQQTAAIEVLLKDTNAILTGQIDQLIVLFETTAPEFYNSYKNARIIIDLHGGIGTYSGTIAGNSTKNLFSNATDDAEIFELNNTGTVSIDFGRGSSASDTGTPFRLNAGDTIEKSASELGASGNKYFNVKNGNPDEGSYKVVRL